MISYLFHSITAGLWAYVWHWGLSIGTIVLLVIGGIFGGSIPIIGHELRKDCWWAAAGVALLLVGMGIGVRYGEARCAAQVIVLEKHVGDAVRESKDPK